MRLRKTVSSIFQSRKASGQSNRSTGSPAASPIIEKTGGLSPSDTSDPVSSNPVSMDGKDERKSRRKSWLGRSKSTEKVAQEPAAWILNHPERLPYDTTLITDNNQPLDVWDDSGDCDVHIFPRTSSQGPSFRIDSTILASSKLLSDLILPLETDLSTWGGGVVRIARVPTDCFATPGVSSTRPGEFNTPSIDPKHGSRCWILMPATSQALRSDYENIIAVRNLFGFLTNRPLVATRAHPTVVSVFVKLAETLTRFGFSNLDGSTFGEIATSCFDSYVDEFDLTDVRYSNEKTIQGILLGERLKNVKLYNEAFTHAVGKHDELFRFGSPELGLMSPITFNRLNRAAMNLEKRTASVRHTLKDFDFPQIFSGTLNSKTVDERKDVDFDLLRNSFFSTRRFVLSFYKAHYGSWPPKASKENELETNGLNRIVCQNLYHDFCAVYDLLVDRSSLTNRTADSVLIDDKDVDLPAIRALRAVLSEYDRSTPPVRPPIPFDLPIIPSLRQTRSGNGWSDSKREIKAISKKLKDDDIAEIMTASHNTDVPPSPFLNSFREIERKAARHCTIKELSELRIGQWLFVYAVLQTLPMVVVDGPQLRYTQEVEYFLCEPPSFGVPWVTEDALRDTSNTRSTRAGDVSCLPADTIHHGTEGIYFRSHCWQMAKQWTTGNTVLYEAVEVETQERSYKSSSPASSIQDRKAVHLSPDSAQTPSDGKHRSRPVSIYDPNLTFDSILGSNASSSKAQK
ncbi:hypothetical protein E4T38_02727 [Aureobasidium subglaciale]|nr:hypothetical protein E4T38_02727 [Aureobasidium subglaciale]KAI5230905.1 hypothetical protein E4T41_02726 [Aureobasidium subglaciale]KAI5265099.1 hypothetical protein E4T46_02504 [Aureobasidium subglaciale]